MLSIIGLVGGLTLLIVLTMRGKNLLLIAPLCACFVALFSSMPLFPQLADADASSLVGNYMAGFSGFISSWFFMFLLGSIFGKMMEDSGTADSVSRWVVEKIGVKRAALSVVAACAILTYGGVSLFVVAFSVYPVALKLFKQANLPRRFIPATLAFGSVTFSMTSAGSPEIQNWIPVEYLNTSPYAGWEVSIVVAAFMALFGYWWLRKMIDKAVDRGETFEDRVSDAAVVEERRDDPSPVLGMVPLIIVLAISFVYHDSLKQSALIVALLGGILSTWLLNRKRLPDVWDTASAGTMGALLAIANTAAVVGFGSVARAVPSFTLAVDAVTSIPGSPLLGAAIAISAIAGLTGSASGGQAIALPILAPGYLDMGVNPEALHRTIAISSGALDTLPHNGYVVTTIRVICGETHEAAYAPLSALTVIVPLIGTAIALVLFSLIVAG